MTDRRRVRSLAVPLALVLVGGGVLLALLGSQLRPTAYSSPEPTVQTTQVTTTSPTASPHGPDDSGDDDGSDRARHQIGGLLVGLYLAFLATLLGFVVVAVLRSIGAWRPGRFARGRRAPPPRMPEADPRAELAARLASAAAAGLDELVAEGPASDVIIVCWQRMRAAAEIAGAEPVASDTPDEVVVRVAAALSPELTAPLRRLAGLYREARFSEHDMTRGDVWVARQELRTVLAVLDPESHAPGARASPDDATVDPDVR